jgi:hypothetical protein
MRSMIACSVSSRLPLDDDGSSSLPLSFARSTTLRSRAMASTETSGNTWRDGRYSCGACRKPLAKRSSDAKRMSPAPLCRQLSLPALASVKYGGTGAIPWTGGHLSRDTAACLNPVWRRHRDRPASWSARPCNHSSRNAGGPRAKPVDQRASSSCERATGRAAPSYGSAVAVRNGMPDALSLRFGGVTVKFRAQAAQAA